MRAAERIPTADLKPEDNRAVLYCSTADPVRQRELAAHARLLGRLSLELTRDRSTLSVPSLTHGQFARVDFDLVRSFGPRLVFGLSLPSLRHDISRSYEPKAPVPAQRLAALRAAKHTGLHY